MWVMVASGSTRNSSHLTSQQHVPPSPRGSQGILGPDEIYNPLSNFWGHCGVSIQLELPKGPPEGVVQEAHLSDSRITSAHFFQCERSLQDSELLKLIWKCFHPDHIWLQTTLVHTEGHELMKPIQLHHLQVPNPDTFQASAVPWNEYQKRGLRQGATLLVSSTHWEHVTLLQE